MTDNRKDALASALSMIEKQFWAGSVMKLGEKSHLDIATSSSGSILLDDALGGWYAKWRIVEIYGPESSWKTTLTLHAIAEVQKNGWTAAFIDAEHALDPVYAKKLGVDAFLSGEVSERTWYQAKELEIDYFACGHHATERFGVQALGAHLSSKFGLEHHFIDSENPIWTEEP